MTAPRETTCRSCRVANPAWARWCGRCGDELPATPPTALRRIRRHRRPLTAVAAVLLTAAALTVAVVTLGGSLPEGWPPDLQTAPPDDGVSLPERSGVTDRPGGSQREPTGAGEPGDEAIPPCPAGDVVPDGPCARWSLDAVAGDGRDDPVTRIGDDVILARADGSLERRSRHDGRRRWNAELGTTRPGPAHEGDVLVAIDDRDLALLDAATGRPHWRVPVADASPPLRGTHRMIRHLGLTSDTAYSVIDNRLVAFDRDTGEVRWRWADQHVLSAGVADGAPYVLPVDGVIGLDPGTGERRWRVPQITFDHRLHRLVGAHLVVGDATGRLTAIDPASGAVRWGRDLPGGARAHEVLVSPQGLLVDLDRAGYALVDPASGDRIATHGAVQANRWEVLAVSPTVAIVRRQPGAPVVLGVDVATSRVRWETPLGAAVTQASILRDEVRVTTTDGVFGLDPRDGDVRWSGALPGRGQLLAGPDPMLLLHQDGILAIQPPPGGA